MNDADWLIIALILCEGEGEKHTLILQPDTSRVCPCARTWERANNYTYVDTHGHMINAVVFCYVFFFPK